MMYRASFEAIWPYITLAALAVATSYAVYSLISVIILIGVVVFGWGRL